MDPTKDLAAYGYGSVAWKDRVNSWRMKHGKMQVVMTEGAQIQPTAVEVEVDLKAPELPMYIT